MIPQEALDLYLWLKGFSLSDTISIGEVLNAFEDCEVEEC